MAIQVNHTSDASGVERAARGVVAQQGDGFAACGLRLERFVNLGKIGLLYTVRAVIVLGNSGAFNQIGGRIGGAERTGSNLNRRFCGVIGSGICAVINRLKRTANGAARD